MTVEIVDITDDAEALRAPTEEIVDENPQATEWSLAALRAQDLTRIVPEAYTSWDAFAAHAVTTASESPAVKRRALGAAVVFGAMVTVLTSIGWTSLGTLMLAISMGFPAYLATVAALLANPILAVAIATVLAPAMYALWSHRVIALAVHEILASYEDEWWRLYDLKTVEGVEGITKLFDRVVAEIIARLLWQDA